MSSPATVVIVDDHSGTRAVLRAIVEDAGFAVAGDAADGAAAVELVRALRPNLVTMDIEMPILDGLAATRSIRAHPEPPIVVIVSGSLGDTARKQAAIDAGAHCLIAKTAAYRDLPPLLHALLP